MDISFRDIDAAADLAPTYNEQWASVPFCYPVTPEEFQDGLRLGRDGEPDERLRERKLLVAEQEGETVAFADVALADVEQEKNQGLIRFFTYRSGCRPAAQSLLEASEKYLRDLNAERVYAFLKTFSYRFYHLAFGMLSDRQGPICGLLGINGFKLHSGEIFLARSIPDLAEPLPPDEQVDVSVKQDPGRGALPNLTVSAVRAGREIGACYSHSVGEYVRAQDAQTSCFTVGLGTQDSEQGKGWGLYLLQKSVWEMRKIGYEVAVISTDRENYRALLLYANYGYQMIDTTYEFVKEI